MRLTNVGEIGNGRACAILLARQGAKVALLDFNEQWAQDTKEMIDAEGGISEVVKVDVTNEDSVQKAMQKTVDLFGRLDILVNIGEWALCDLDESTETTNLWSHSWRGWCHGRCN